MNESDQGTPEDAKPEEVTPSTSEAPSKSPVDKSVKDERMWAMFTHLSALSGFVGVPLGNIVGPLVIWMIKKDDYPALEAHGKEALNFQISILIYFLVLSFVGVLTMVILIGFLFLLAAGLVYVAGIIFTVIAALKANDGEMYEYPFTIRLVN